MQHVILVKKRDKRRPGFCHPAIAGGGNTAVCLCNQAETIVPAATCLRHIDRAVG